MKVLTEAEIQARLYGGYRRGASSSRMVAQDAGAVRKETPWRQMGTTTSFLQGSKPDSKWTGTEILASELDRLRSELIVLRQERERLEEAMIRQRKMIETPLPERASSHSDDPGAGRWKKLFGGVFVFLVLGVILGYPAGVQFLQASPILFQEASPYTVQVVVYDVRPMADQVLAYLQEIGYPAFVVETKRRNGKPRYVVCVGQFVSRDEAVLEKKRLVEDPRFSDAFVKLR
ncbi:MAG: SPOR domain-containing protein [Candidatus Omnitrophica bacterium]|nr:SPOR domain-containing protein [Candidatus Omnitrophota bacterium]